MPKLQKIEYWGFNHDVVCEHFEGEITFCGEFSLNNEDFPVAVYKSKKPDTSKGHKKYLLLQPHSMGQQKVSVRGMSAREMAKHRRQEALHCHHCDYVIFSMSRHDFHGCGCSGENKRICVDGGKAYLRYLWGKEADFDVVELDHLTGKIKFIRKGGQRG